MHRTGSAVVIVLALLGTTDAAAQAPAPLSPVRSAGQGVTPVFEGWYRNPDGTYSLSFGYFNRNAEETIDIPAGPQNFIEPGEANQGQPAHFLPRRHWGVFAVRVPPDFGDRRVVWTLVVRGHTFAVPGSLKRGWQIDALEGEAGSGNTPPVLTFDPAGPEGRGPGGIIVGPLTVAVGPPLTLTVWASDDGKASGSIANDGRAGVPVTLTWFKHQGPGAVMFSNPKPAVADGKATTAATFSEPGEYVLRLRANDASGIAGAGHAQCCWTNGFVKVRVTR